MRQIVSLKSRSSAIYVSILLCYLESFIDIVLNGYISSMYFTNYHLITNVVSTTTTKKIVHTISIN